jgi:DNA repair exonuclease SbcCD ATPase subunit
LSKPGSYITLEGAKIKNRAYTEFEAENDGDKIYLPVAAVMTLYEYQQRQLTSGPKTTLEVQQMTEDRDRPLPGNDIYESVEDTYSNRLQQLNDQLKQASTKQRDLEEQLAGEKSANLKLVTQLQEDKQRQSHRIAELEQLAVARESSYRDELDQLSSQYSTLEKTYQSIQSRSESQLDSFNTPFDDVHVTQTKLGEGSYGSKQLNGIVIM